jgi:CheY-like chemotaxis protein
MSTPLLALPLSAPIRDAGKKKRVLLIDTSNTKRDLRADVLRKLGMDVDCAADIAEARSWWRPALYNLALINMEKGWGQRDRFCDDLRSATPPQRLAFPVGQPQYLADSPNTDQELAMENTDEQAAVGSARDTFPADPGDLTRRWAFWKLCGESPQSVLRPSLAAKRCAPCPVRHGIPKNVQRNQLRNRPA